MNINFNINDVNIILNMPEIEYIKTLLSLVNLTDKEKDIITLYYFNGLKEIEIADKYGVDTSVKRIIICKLFIIYHKQFS